MPLETKNSEKKGRVLLIASYREKYGEAALKKIRSVIQKTKPTKIIITKIIKEEEIPQVVDAKVGIEEKNDFLDTVHEEKKQQADEYAAEIIELTESFDIPTEVHLRKGRDIGNEIIDEFEKIDAKYVVIHPSHKGVLERLMERSTAKEVMENLPDRRIIPVE